MTFDFDGKLIRFDTNRIPLLNFVLGFFGMSSINEICAKLDNDEAYKQLYKLEKTKEFSAMYRNIIRIVEKEIGTSNFYFQKIPSFRIHRVNGNSVNYHNDCMYGHGEDVVNIWVPLINTNEFNTLHLSDNKTSKKISKKFSNGKLKLSEANKLFRCASNPCLVNYGEMLIFNTSIIHGTEVNNSNDNRISFDFRILPYGSDPSTKQLNDYYVSNRFSEVRKTPCMYYLNKKNPIMNNCSHFVQREIMNTYASSNNLISEGKEETEIHGTSHYPVLFHYIEEEKINNILMSSILCLPRNKKLREEVLILAKINSVKLHFVLENKINENISIDNLNLYYESILEADKIL